MQTPTTTNKQIVPPTTNLITGIQMVTVHVRDLAKARSFYTDVLGLIKTTHDARVNADVFELPGSSTPLAVRELLPNAPAIVPGSPANIVLLVEDVARAATEIARRGGRIVAPMEKSAQGVAFATIADPEGNAFLLTDK